MSEPNLILNLDYKKSYANPLFQNALKCWKMGNDYFTNELDNKDYDKYFTTIFTLIDELLVLRYEIMLKAEYSRSIQISVIRKLTRSNLVMPENLLRGGKMILVTGPQITNDPQIQEEIKNAKTYHTSLNSSLKGFFFISRSLLDNLIPIIKIMYRKQSGQIPSSFFELSSCHALPFKLRKKIRKFEEKFEQLRNFRDALAHKGILVETYFDDDGARFILVNSEEFKLPPKEKEKLTRKSSQMIDYLDKHLELIDRTIITIFGYGVVLPGLKKGNVSFETRKK